MSSKGQIVIPVDMRKGLKEGEKFVIIKKGDQMILQKLSKFDKKMEEDIEFARRTEAAYKRYEKGEFVRRSAEDFLKELEKW